MVPEGSEARAPLTEGNCEAGAPPPDAAGADDAADPPPTAGNGELPPDCGAPAPDTGGNAPCAHTEPTGTASTVSTTGTSSRRTITIMSLERGLFCDSGRLRP